MMKSVTQLKRITVLIHFWNYSCTVSEPEAVTEPETAALESNTHAHTTTTPKCERTIHDPVMTIPEP